MAGGERHGARRPPRHVALVAVTYRSAEMLPAFFAALPAALEGVDGAELVIVDSASDDDSVRIASGSPLVDHLVVLEENRGYAAGINAGIAACPGRDAYLVLNPDVRLWPGAVCRLCDAMGRSGAGIVVPQLRDEHGALLWSLRREPTLLRAVGEAVLGGTRAGRWDFLGERIVDDAVYTHDTAAAWATGGAMLLSDECVTHTGPWDETFFLYEEEVDFALRARDRGFGLRYAPEARATRIIGDHPPDPSIWALMRLNKWALYRRRHGRLRSHAFRLALVLGEGLRSVGGRRANRAALRALLAGDRDTHRDRTRVRPTG